MSEELIGRGQDFGSALREFIQRTPAASADNAATLTDLTVDQVRAVTTPTDVGLSLLKNYPVATTSEAQLGVQNDRYMTPLRVSEHLTAHLGEMQGAVGDTVYGAGASGWTMSQLLARLAVVNTQAELDAQQTIVESFGSVFNTWRRISHADGSSFPANSSELDSWSYDADTDRISCTVNSSTLVGFISPQAYGDFTFETRVLSASGDDDSVGVCFGFVEADGQEHTLTAIRTTGGVQGHPNHSGTPHTAKLFDVYYDIFTPGKIDLGSTNGGLKWGDGVVDDARVPAGDLGAGGWAAHPTGCKIKVERVGDVITLSTTDLGGETYVPSATVVVDLTTHPALEPFRGRIRVGYVAYSQPSSSWVSLIRPGERSAIVDARNMDTLEWTGTQWTPGNYVDHVHAGRFYYNRDTGKTYYAEQSDRLLHVMG